jgi:mannose-1-phosphate guanylyltransferase
MLHHWFKLLKSHGIRDILINLHHLPFMVRRYVEHFNLINPSFRIVTSYEPRLLGSAGAIRANASWIKDERDFLIAYADNLTNANLQELISFHQDAEAILTMGLFHTDNPQGCGIATMDRDGIVVDFVEKPEYTESNLANAGIYVSSPELLDYIPEGFADLGHDVLGKLVGKMAGYEIKGYLRDIGTMDSYEKAKMEWRERVAL